MLRGDDAAVGRRDDIHPLQLVRHPVGALDHRALDADAVARAVKPASIRQDVINEGKEKGWSFLVFIRDKESKQLAGSALFDTNPQTGIYCVAAYDRSRFSKPVGHIVQAVAMERMREKGVRWYEIGERNYPADPGAYDKLVDIGHYKEGFATHFWPKVFVKINREDFMSHILK